MIFNYRRLNDNCHDEILTVIYCLDVLLLFICDKKEITVRTYCEVIVKYHNQTKGTRKTLNTKRWIKFVDIIINKGLRINWEHIEGANNFLSTLYPK